MSLVDSAVAPIKMGDYVPLATSADLKAIRDKYGLSSGDTIAAARTDIAELAGVAFEGLSPALRNKAELGTLDDLYGPDRAIKSPYSNPLFTRHAEEDLFNAVAQRIDNAGIPTEQLSGKVLDIKISNLKGVCNKCTAGLGGASDLSGVVRQFSQRYPELTIRLTSEGGNAMPGKTTVIVRGGQIVEP